MTGTAAPCTSLFKPVAVDDPLEAIGSPGAVADNESLWWRHERLHRAVMRDPVRLGRAYFADRDAVEAAWLADPPEPSAAFAEAAQLEADWLERVLAETGGDVRPRFVRRFWRKTTARAKLEVGTAKGPALAVSR